MAIDTLKPGQQVKVTINNQIRRAAARKTLERLFMTDRAVSGPIEARTKNHVNKPKRRGGCIWVNRPNKVHPTLERGCSATITTTPANIKDLNSVSDLVDVQVAG